MYLGQSVQSRWSGAGWTQLSACLQLVMIFLAMPWFSVLLNLWDPCLVFYKLGLEEGKKSSVCSLRC